MADLSVPPPTAGAREGLGKAGAFLRRDLRVMLSYRTVLVSDAALLAVQLGLFAFVSRMVDTGTLPSFDGRRPTYLEFVTVGIAVHALVQLGLGRVVAAMRREQLTGTLEYLVTTPTSVPVLALGSIAFDAVYVPLRTVLFLALAVGMFDLGYDLAGVVPAVTVLVLLTVTVWGIGVILAAALLTWRRGGTGVGISGLVVGALSGAYFPISLLPGWLHPVATASPATVGLHAVRESLLGAGGWAAVWPALLVLVPWMVSTVSVGLLVFRLSLRRELRRGSIGLY